MKTYVLVFALSLFTLGACGQKQEEAPQAPETEQVAPAESMSADTTAAMSADTTAQE